jgi:ribosome biogenesis GTPase / thiamine phosphate phosphatase
MSVRGVVLEGTGGVWRIHLPDGETVDAAMRGRLKQDEGIRIKLAVGDEVTIDRDARDANQIGGWAIEEIHPRRSQLARRAPGSRAMERIVVANVDQVIVVFAFVKPEPHARMIDRFLVIAESNDITARLVLNKCELVDAATAKAFAAPYEAAGYPVHFTSVKERTGLEALHDAMHGRVSALTGPSGVGKSSLLNAIFPGADLRVAEISESVNKGRHTTVGARLLPLPGGGFVADTPGLREVGMWGLEATQVDRCFPEFRPYIGECRFQDCAHNTEPGCRVREAIAAGDVSADRHESYLKLRLELTEAPKQY